MSKDNLIEFIKTYVSECETFAESCKEYQKKLEERLENAMKNEEELKILQGYIEKLQVQLQTLNENNDKSIALNNELQNRARDLSNEVNICKEINDKLQPEFEEKKLRVEKIEAELKTKEELIHQYDKKFYELKVKTQQKIDSSEEKIAKLEKVIEKKKKEIEDLIRENGSITFNANELAQERVELKKEIIIAERTISHLAKEKNSLELKYSSLQSKLNKSNIKVLTKEVQTDYEVNSMLLQKEEELKAAKEFANLLSEKLDNVRQRLGKIEEQNKINEKLLDETRNYIKTLEYERDLLITENKDLKERRERANTEITKLRENITKKSSRLKTTSQAVHYLSHLDDCFN